MFNLSVSVIYGNFYVEQLLIVFEYPKKIIRKQFLWGWGFSTD